MKELYTALVAFQSELTPVGKSATNPFFKSKYAPLHEVVALVNPLLAKHKLAVLQPMTELNGSPALKTIIVHESGESIEEVTPLFLVKEDPQSHGSAVTYARRYGLMSILGIVADEDDDGNKATKAKNQPRTREEGHEAEIKAREDTELKKAKEALNEEFKKHDYTTVDQKRTFITMVLGKNTIDNLNDVYTVGDALDNEN